MSVEQAEEAVAARAGQPHEVGARSPQERGGLVAAAALVAAGLVAAVLFTVLAAHASGRASDREQALAAARTRVPLLLTYSYRTLADDLARSEDQATGRFRKDYAKLLDDAVTPAATTKRISTRATLSGAGVVDETGSKVTVLVFLTQRTTAPGSAPSVNTSRVEVTMRHVGDTWKIAGLTPR
jgi:Mce-associated membrane protein